MSVILDIKSVRDAYEKTGGLFMAATVLRSLSPKLRGSLLLGMFLLLCTAFLLIKMFHSPIASVPVLGIMVLWECARRVAFEKHYTANSPMIQAFPKYEQGLRYQVFKTNIPPELLSDKARLASLLALLEKRQRVRSSSAFSRRPLVAASMGLLLFLASAAVRHVPAEIILPLAAFAAVLIGFIIMNLRMVADMWRTQAYKDEELSEFVLWLAVEAGAELQAIHD